MRARSRAFPVRGDGSTLLRLRIRVVPVFASSAAFSAVFAPVGGAPRRTPARWSVAGGALPVARLVRQIE
ncbi:hypothetical protein CG747_12190 [Streptomyces sp. CB02959]|nr:hypothetical protein CG747_12190 [Streptomyces sp. CB02959]